MKSSPSLPLLLFGSLSFLAQQNAEAWVSHISFQRTTTVTTSSTSLHMFDWFKPKPAASSSAKKEEPKDALSQMFNQGGESTTTETSSTPADTKEDKVAEKVEEKLASAELQPPPPAVEEKEDEVVSSSDSSAKAESTPKTNPDGIVQGKVTWYDRERGYGFILPETHQGSISKDDQVFCHQTDIKAEGFRMLFRGEDVEFQLVHDDKGRSRATQVTGPQGGQLRVDTPQPPKKSDE